MRKTKLGNSNYDFATCSIKTEMKYGSVKLRSAVTWGSFLESFDN